MSDASFGVTHHKNGLQTINIQDAYLYSHTYLNTPVQEQERKRAMTATATCMSSYGLLKQKILTPQVLSRVQMTPQASQVT